MTIDNWPWLSAARSLRQWRTIDTLMRSVRRDADLLGLILQGSFAGGVADPVSDLDVMIVAQPGAFDRIWARRRELVSNSLAFWDQLIEDRVDCGVAVWLDREVVLVEATLTTPGHARIAEGAPSVVLVGPTDLVERFPTRPRVRRAEMAFTHPVEKALKELQFAVRGEVTDRPWEG